MLGNILSLPSRLTCSSVVALLLEFAYHTRLLMPSSLAKFIKHWAAETRGNSASIDAADCIFKPSFRLAKCFPPKKMSIFKPGATRENLVARRLVFTGPIIEDIRSKYVNGSISKPPTHAEALSALIWDRFVAATGLQEELDQKLYPLIQADMRKRIPSMELDACFGNISLSAIIKPSQLSANNDKRDIIKLMRDAIEDLNCDYAMRIREENEFSNLLIKFHGNIAKWCLIPRL